MNRSIAVAAIACALSLFATSAVAHDPKEHAKEKAAAEAKANCAAMKNMDMSKMNPNDPVAVAMHKKCAGTEAQEPGHVDAHHHAAAPPVAPAKRDEHGEH